MEIAGDATAAVENDIAVLAANAPRQIVSDLPIRERVLVLNDVDPLPADGRTGCALWARLALEPLIARVAFGALRTYRALRPHGALRPSRPRRPLQSLRSDCAVTPGSALRASEPRLPFGAT